MFYISFVRFGLTYLIQNIIYQHFRKTPVVLCNAYWHTILLSRRRFAKGLPFLQPFRKHFLNPLPQGALACILLLSLQPLEYTRDGSQPKLLRFAHA